MNKEEFIKAIEELNIKCDELKLNKLEKYYETLVKWNEKMNLTAITEKKDVYLKHFYDSLTLVKAIDLNEIHSLLDVGSGAGFPGIVIKIFYPNLKLDIVDSNNKRIIFLQELSKELGLENVNLYHDRCENFVYQHEEQYDLVTSRAVANLNTLLELCIKAVRINHYFIPMKANVEQEMLQINNELNILNCRVEEVITFKLPKENSIRNLVKIKKEKATPKEYPRVYDKIKKKPL